MANQNEHRQRLLEAQNANRGRPRKGEVRAKRKQVNITKRTLLEEALREPFRHYQDGYLEGFE